MSEQAIFLSVFIGAFPAGLFIGWLIDHGKQPPGPPGPGPVPPAKNR